MRRLLETWPLGQLWLLTSSMGARATESRDPIPPPEYCRIVRRFSGPGRFFPIVNLLNYCMIPWIVWKGCTMVRQKRIELLFSLPWGEYFIAAYLIHLLTRCELFVYVLDDHPGGSSKWSVSQPLYKLLMGKILRSAKSVWGVSPYMCDSLQRRFGVACRPQLPFLNVEEFARQAGASVAQSNGELLIVYTGAIYSAQIDAVHDLVEVLSDPKTQQDVRARLTLCTPVPESTLRSMGLYGPNIEAQFVPASDMSMHFALRGRPISSAVLQ